MTIKRSKYIVSFSNFSKKWMVINDITGTAQSAWNNAREARKVASMLSAVIA